MKRSPKELLSNLKYYYAIIDKNCTGLDERGLRRRQEVSFKNYCISLLLMINNTIPKYQCH